MAESEHHEEERLRPHAEMSDTADAPDLFRDYDHQAVLMAIEETAGSWSDLDCDALIVDLYAAREAGFRPMNRPRCQTSLTPLLSRVRYVSQTGWR